MNYIIVYKLNGIAQILFMMFRDESNIFFNEDTFIESIDDVIYVMDTFIRPDNDAFVVQETLLDSQAFKENKNSIFNYLLEIYNE